MQYVFKNKQILSVIIMSAFVWSNIAQADILSATVEFSVPLNNQAGPNEPFTPLVHFNGVNYVVWVDANFRPWVSQKDTCSDMVTVPLDTNPDYTAYPDGHHRYSMGIDKNGYLHIAGDMHYYPSGPDSNNYLPARYKNQTVMYWISNQPYDATAGFTFAGGAGSSTAIPGQYFNTGYFFNDKYGQLYFTAMISAYQSLSFREQGEMGVGLYKYDVVNKTWSIIGDYGDAVFPDSHKVKKWKAFFWENAGLGTPGWFQNYQPSFTFDNNNHLHFSLAATVDIAFQGNTRVLYAVSKDGGQTWQRANGSLIPSLPLRGIDSSPSCADVVIDSKGAYFLNVASCVFADAQGRPFVNAGNSTYGVPSVWYRWNGASWTGDSSNSHKLFGALGFLGPDGKITTIQADYIWLRRSADYTQLSSAYYLQGYLPVLGLHNLQCISKIGLRNTGSLYGIGMNTESNMMQILNLSFDSTPLPWGWSFQDVGAGVSMGGAAGYNDGTFTVRASGGGVGGTADTLGFAYYKLTGNGTIIARVASRDNMAPSFVDGIMMRESLSAYSKCAMIGISNGGLINFEYRIATGAQAVIRLMYNPPAWYKLVRAGNIFTAYYSADGIAWTQFEQPLTIPMNSTIYVGLASNGSPSNNVHTCTFDNVEIF